MTHGLLSLAAKASGASLRKISSASGFQLHQKLRAMEVNFWRFVIYLRKSVKWARSPSVPLRASRPHRRRRCARDPTIGGAGHKLAPPSSANRKAGQIRRTQAPVIRIEE